MSFDHLEKSISRTIHRQIVWALSAGLVFLGTIGGVTAYAEISGAVVATGKIIVMGRAKKVDHPEGGIIAAMTVKEGDRVQAGDTLFRLDGTTAQASLTIVESQLAQLLVQEARLLSEQAGRKDLDLPQEMRVLPEDKQQLLQQAQQKLMEAREISRNSQKAQLTKQIAQFGEQIAALAAQKTAVDENIALLSEQLRRNESLSERGLITQAQLIATQREKASLLGSQAALTSEVIETEQAKSQAELRLIQVDETFYEAVLTELDQKRPEIARLTQERIAASDKLRRLEIKAPISGYLHQLNIHTIGSVAAPGSELVSIVPEDDELVIEAMMGATDVDQVYAGQSARVRFSGLNQRVTPELQAAVLDVSPDLTTDPKTGASYYIARLRIPDDEIAKVGDVALKPGMPAEVFIETERRTIMSYLIKPLSDQFQHALRES
jgi:HlyD family type I secretion membrane fusion protein